MIRRAHRLFSRERPARASFAVHALRSRASLLLFLGAGALAAGCGDGGPYRACADAEDCEAPEEATAECLEKEKEGFCTWACDDDDDCEEADDEDFDFVCASFESESGKHCFPGCEGEDEEGACPSGMGCRSTGGGSDNRKVCFPDG